MDELRDASTLLEHALAETLNALELGPEHAAAQRLAIRYAQVIDSCRDQAWAMRWVAPGLLAVLTELGATPAAKAGLMKGAKPADARPQGLAALRTAK